MIYTTLLSLLTLALLTAIFFLTGCRFVLRHLYRYQVHAKLYKNPEFFRALRPKLLRMDSKREVELLLFFLSAGRQICGYAFALSALVLLFQTSGNLYFQHSLLSLPISIALLLGSFLFFGTLIPQIWAKRHPSSCFRTSEKIVSPLLLGLYPFIFPLAYLFLKLTRPPKHAVSKGEIQAKIHEVLQEVDSSPTLTPLEGKLVESIINFKDQIAREVMVPRTHLFSMPISLSLQEAAFEMNDKGYSRVPLFGSSLDDIRGVLFYKDLFNALLEAIKDPLHAKTVEQLAKPVYFVPETKKAAELLQHFKTTKQHIAVVVDEYGGTEGIVTLEDIIEEIVGDIVDEYDEEPSLFTPLESGGWIVDAKMNLSDIQEMLGVKLPEASDYDTLGGFIVDWAGAIPTKGLKLHFDEYELEVIESSERKIEKVKITPLSLYSEQKRLG